MMGYISNTAISTYNYNSQQYTCSITSFVTTKEDQNCELIDFLNSKFITALPQYMQNVLKFTNRRYICDGGSQNYYYNNDDYMSWTSQGIKSHKVSLLNLKELGFNASVERKSSGNYEITGVGVYSYSGTTSSNSQKKMVEFINDNINSCGVTLKYFEDGGSRIKKRLNRPVDYLINDTLLFASKRDNVISSSDYKGAIAYYMTSDGELVTNNLSSEAQVKAQRGISPIMFI